MSLDPIGLIISDMMQRHLADLLAMPNQWTNRESDYLQRIQTAVIHFQQMWTELNAKSDLAYVSHELRTPLSPILGYGELLEHILPQPMPKALATSFTYLRLGGRILLLKVNELLDRAKNQQLIQSNMQLGTGINLNDLDLIDRSLDAVLELRLIADNWTEQQAICLEELHAAFLRLNHYWQILDPSVIKELRLAESNIGLIDNLIKFINHDYKGEKGQDFLQKLTVFSQKLEAKLRYLAVKNYF